MSDLHPSRYSDPYQRLAYLDGLAKGMTIADGNKPLFMRLVREWKRRTELKIGRA